MNSAPPYPRTAYLLSLIGGILIVLYALLEVAEAIAFRSEIESLLPGAARLLVGLGSIGVISGVIVVIGAIQLKGNPSSAKTWGILILVFSLVSFVGGGGLFVGLLLGLIGGIMALTWTPPAAVGPMYGAPGYGGPATSPVGSPPWGSPAPPPSSSTGVQRFCSSCGSPNAPTAKFCAKCGAPLQ